MQVFDHFCPWVGNVIGKHNRHLFLMFIGCMTVALVGAYCVGLGRLSQTGFFSWGPRHRSQFTPAMTWSLIWMICNIPLLFTVVGLAVAQTVQVCVCAVPGSSSERGGAWWARRSMSVSQLCGRLWSHTDKSLLQVMESEVQLIPAVTMGCVDVAGGTEHDNERNDQLAQVQALPGEQRHGVGECV